AISKQYLHNLLQLAELPEEVVQAFSSPMDLKVSYGMKLSPLAKSPDQRDALFAAALKIRNEQENRQSLSENPIEGAQVFQRLLQASQKPIVSKVPNRARSTFECASGERIGEILSDTRS